MSLMTSSGNSQEHTSEALRVVGVPDALLFFANAETYTGEFATSLTGLLGKLDKVPLESVEFHFQRGDFEKWVGRTLGDENLANKLREIDRFTRGEELKIALKEAIRKHLEQLGQAV